MELMPWRLFGTLGSTRKGLDSLCCRFFRETPSMGAFTEEWLPFVDISETKKNFIVKAEIPGLDAAGKIAVEARAALNTALEKTKGSINNVEGKTKEQMKDALAHLNKAEEIGKAGRRWRRHQGLCCAEKK